MEFNVYLLLFTVGALCAFTNGDKSCRCEVGWSPFDEPTQWDATFRSARLNDTTLVTGRKCSQWSMDCLVKCRAQVDGEMTSHHLIVDPHFHLGRKLCDLQGVPISPDNPRHMYMFSTAAGCDRVMTTMGDLCCFGCISTDLHWQIMYDPQCSSKPFAGCRSEFVLKR